MNLPPPASNWAVFKLVWKTARLRAAARRRRQRELMNHKTGDDTDVLGAIATIMLTLFSFFIHGALGWAVVGSLEIAQIANIEDHGQIVLAGGSRGYFFDKLLEVQKRNDESGGHLSNRSSGSSTVEASSAKTRNTVEEALEAFADAAAERRTREMGGAKESNKAKIKTQFERFGAAGFMHEGDLPKIDLRNPKTIPANYWPFMGFMLLWWILMMVFQGEGLDLDIQRRRHPMWEWLLSHPVRPVAAFASDMLSPLMANPVYFGAPVFWMVVLGSIHGWPGTILGAMVVGLSFAIVASCLNKAVEISVMLRLAPRSRGAVLGLMSWFGYAAMMLPLFTMNAVGLKSFLVIGLARLTPWLPTWPMRALTIGWDDAPAIWQVVISGVGVAGLLLALSLIVAWWGLSRGLQAGDQSSNFVAGTMSDPAKSPLLANNPVFRKELLWFWRDKGAVVQAILIPLTIASFQVINLRGLLDKAIDRWNGICGVAVICGTYFLLVLGPRSLASEGGALWIAMTWPRGMEDLLKAKARLWWWLSNLIVGFILIVAVAMFPNNWWCVGLVAVGWFFFGRSLADKTVTLVTAPSSSGEPEPAPRGRQWPVMLGTLAFGSGVITQTWDAAMMGVVFSSLAAAAIWQNFRARLPYLFDPWSEKLPPAPTLMHAMIGIALMVEVLAVTSGTAMALGGTTYLWQTRAVAYGLTGFTAWLVMDRFLARRGVTAAEVWQWPRDLSPYRIFAGGGVLAGAALGGLALLYLMGLKALPLTHDWMVQMAKITAGQATYKAWILLLAVGMAPVAEEYFFRGLLFRALDREWGGWRAMIGSAAYFAMYHPPVAWPPVFAMGFCNAWLFKKSGSLIPCVLLHMTYNAVVVGMG